MNRREVLAAVASACSAVGITSKAAQVVCDEPEPILAVIHCSATLTAENQFRLVEHWEQLRKICPKLPPCIVMDRSLSLDFVAAKDLVK
jgi:hypothetical protein